MRDELFRRRYRRSMRKEQEARLSEAVFFPGPRRDGRAFLRLLIEPELTLIPGARSLPDQQSIPNASCSGRAPIWEFLPASASSIQQYLLTGAAGSGKTTLFRQTAWLLAGGRDGHHRRVPDLLPILLTLPASPLLAERRAGVSLGDVVCEQIQQRWQQTLPRTSIEWFLATGKCVVLLDELDAFANPLTRTHVALWIQQQMRTYPQHCFIVATRSLEDGGVLLEEMVALEIRPFKPQQIVQYLSQRFSVSGRGHFWEKAQGDVSRQQWVQLFLRHMAMTPSFHALASTPLHLMLLALVYHAQQVLPVQQETLYAAILSVFLDQAKSSNLPAEIVAQIQEMLKRLAWSMLQEGKRRIAIEEAHALLALCLVQGSSLPQAEVLLKMICTRGNLFLHQERQTYHFTSRTLQAYLAALYAREQGLEQVLASQVGQSWWQETLSLFCTKTYAVPLLQACLEQSEPSAPVLALVDTCLEQADALPSSLKAQGEHLLQTHLDAPQPVVQRKATEIWLRKRLRTMVVRENGRSADASLLTCAEYQLFLDAQRLRGRFFQPDHWETASAPAGQDRAPVLGVRASDAQAFCQRLTEQEIGGWRYRLPLRDEAETEHADDALPIASLPSEKGYWMDTRSVVTWKGNHLPGWLSHLKDAVRTQATSDWLRQPAACADFAGLLRQAHTLTKLLLSDCQRDIASHLESACERLQCCDLEQAFVLASPGTQALEHMHMLAFAHTSDLYRVFGGDPSGRLAVAEERRIFTRMRDLTGLLVGAADLSRDLVPFFKQALERGANMPVSAESGTEKTARPDQTPLLLAALRSCILHLACALCTWGNLFFSEEVARGLSSTCAGKIMRIWISRPLSAPGLAT